MKKLLLTLIISTGICLHAGFAQNVYLLHDRESARAAYAADRLSAELIEQGYEILDERSGYDYLVNIGINEHTLQEEGYSIIPEGRFITVYGGDDRGMIYGSLSIVEELRNGGRLETIEARSENAYFPFRGIKHNLPWDTYRPSYSLDQHYDTARDLDYWEAFLDMMAENRFNVLSLWNLHPFTYMIMPKNFPEASPFSAEELAEWQELYRGIFRMAKDRAIDTYIVNWSIFVSEEFSQAHDVAHDNFYPHYYVSGDTSEIVKRYTRESVTQVLEEYPDLTGWAISHGEGMAGMEPQERQAWMDEVMIEGMRLADRETKFVHRVPFSAGTSSAGSTSLDTEQLTRDAMEAIDFFEGPIWVEMKFNWSHAHSTPELVKVHGGPLGDTYFVPEPENYKVTWMARNEDFFALRWGVPDFIRSHIDHNNQSYVGGYFVGSETYIPALDYFTAIDEPVDWTYAFERQWLFYKTWGRLLYDPETPDEVFRSGFTRRYGEPGDNLLEAFALASSTPLRLASSFDLRWDFTLYSEGFLALDGQDVDYITVDRIIEQPPLATYYVSVGEYVEGRLSGEVFSEDQITPPVLIGMLERDNREALRLVENIDVSDNPSLMYEVADVKAWANLGLHFAEKLKGAVALQTYRLEGGEEHQLQAIEHLENALVYWDEVIAITRPIYKDMHLTHTMGNSFDRDDSTLFHWEHIRPEVEMDIEIARNSTAGTSN